MTDFARTCPQTLARYGARLGRKLGSKLEYDAVRRLLLIQFALIVLLACAGCEPRDINRQYGVRRGPQGGDSVNGTGVLGRMFEQAGHRVGTWKRLSPRIEQYQTLVWAPDDFKVPTLKQRAYLEGWLSRGSNRTLIYIGRDFDAAPEYWRQMQSGAPAEQVAEIAARLQKCESEHSVERGAVPKTQYARWFIARQADAYKVQELRGPWADGVDAKAAEITVSTTFDIPKANDIPPSSGAPPPPTAPAAPTATGAGQKTSPKTKRVRPARATASAKTPTTPTVAPAEPQYLPIPEVLLSTDRDDILVSRLTQRADGGGAINPEATTATWQTAWPNNQIIVVTNGSFVLNMQLVNHEHRKLATKLVEACGPPGKVAFLESDYDEMEVVDKEPEHRQPTGFELFTLFPINAVVLHLIALGILFCFARSPIFGRPQTLPAEGLSDFGKHIDAVAEFLQLTHRAEFARKKLEIYQQKCKPGGTTRRGPSPPGPPPAGPNLPKEQR